MINIKKLEVCDENNYSNLINSYPYSMLHHTLKYRNFLNKFLPNSEDHYVCAYENNKLVAALPLFIQKNKYGSVINSLPFFGSHGGFVHLDYKNKSISSEILKYVYKLEEQIGARSTTLIQSLFEPNRALYHEFKANLFDERIGQITNLPDLKSPEELENRLLYSFHSQTRWSIKKGIKAGFNITHGFDAETILILKKLHSSNMQRIGGIKKPDQMFDAIPQVFTYDDDFRIYKATRDGVVISILLVFYHKQCVEYFIPATNILYRNQQPLSALIFQAMKDAIIEKSMKIWNWGGTWKSQEGVYRFKKRWNATDIEYRYFIKRDTGDQTKFHQGDAQVQFPFFYIEPFK